MRQEIGELRDMIERQAYQLKQLQQQRSTATTIQNQSAQRVTSPEAGRPSGTTAAYLPQVPR